MNTNYEKLPPDLLQSHLLNRKQQLEALISQIKQALAKAPQGKLRLSTCNKTVQYYLMDESDKKSFQYLAKQKMPLIKQLAQKDYNLKLLPLLQKEMWHITENLKYLQKNHIDSIYNNFSENRKLLVEPVTLPDSTFVQKWQAMDYNGKAFKEDASVILTAKGERVRSKSEVIIADTLFRLGIPYRYEFPVSLENFTVHPDFYCLNVRTRKEFLWEHLGMMDVEEYAASAVEKIDAYENAGFFPGDNLIFTMETKAQPFSSKKVEQIAKHYLM